MLKFILLLPIVLLASCQTNDIKNDSISQNIVAYGNEGFSISYNQLDNTLKQELYDELNQIHLIRKVALKKIIENKLLSLEAEKYNVTPDEYLYKYVRPNSSKKTLNDFVNENDYQSDVSVLRRGIENLNISSEEGEMELKKRYEKYLKEYLYDSLKVAYNIISTLKPPKSPTIDLNDIDIQYRGNLISATSVIIVSDFECSRCQENAEMYDELYEKYGDKVKFGFGHFSSRTTLSMMASESAGQQGKFWEMHDKIFSYKNLPDTIQLINFAEELNLDMKQFRSSLSDYDLNHSVYRNIMSLSNKGLYGTPTILINNRVIFDSSSKESIESLIEESLKEN